MKNAFEANTNLAIHVTDLERAKSFYIDVLGFSLRKETRDQLEMTSGFITLFVNKDNYVKPFIPALEVNNFKKAKEYLKNNNCKILREWPEYKALYFEDTFGLCINIIERPFSCLKS